MIYEQRKYVPTYNVVCMEIMFHDKVISSISEVALKVFLANSLISLSSFIQNLKY